VTVKYVVGKFYSISVRLTMLYDAISFFLSFFFDKC
jgi:hypothetical protein